MMHPRFKYRGDIDGLRAVAVILVVLFHLDLKAFTGGYIGVDVFFVISGYLISAIIERSWQAKGFSFRNFYARRVKRLFPPIFATVLATFIASLIILTPLDLQNFAKSGAAAVVSLSNIVFFLEAGYWDADSSLKPLLHTWSLGVEEQFYLFWPALLIGLLAIQKRLSLLWSFTLITLIGAAVCLWMSFINPSAAFYLFPFRIFQFSIGALTLILARGHNLNALASHKWMNETLMIIGLAAITWSAMAYNEETLFPGYAVFPPTIGACLVLLAGGAAQDRPNKFSFISILTNPLSTWLGRVSYSLYLVHWPIIVLYRYGTDMEFTAIEQAGLAVAIFVATLILYYGVEKAFYSRGGNQASTENVPSQKGFLWRSAALAMGLILFGGLAWQQSGFYKGASAGEGGVAVTLSPDQIEAGKNARYAYYRKACELENYFESPNCDASRANQVLVFGDSHEVDGFNFFFSGYGQNPEVNLIIFGNMNKCRDFPYENGQWVTTGETCTKRRDFLIDKTFVRNLDVIIYSSRHPFHSNKRVQIRLLNMVKDLNPEIKLITMGPFIETKSDCSTLLNKTGSSLACLSEENSAYFGERNADNRLKNEVMAITDIYVDRIDLACTSNELSTCKSETSDGVLMMYDKNHLSYSYSAELGQKYWGENSNLFNNIKN